jgi:hypothetical protein
MAPESRENGGQGGFQTQCSSTDMLVAARVPLRCRPVWCMVSPVGLQRLDKTTGRDQSSTIHTRAARAHFISKRLLCWGNTGTAAASSNRHHRLRRLVDGVLLCAASSSIFTCSSRHRARATKFDVGS